MYGGHFHALIGSRSQFAGGHLWLQLVASRRFFLNQQSLGCNRLKRVGLPDIRFHDLRHTSATLLLSQGVHPKIVQERLGHSQIGVTMDTYSHVLPTMQREAAGKMNAILAARRPSQQWADCYTAALFGPFGLLERKL
jgi:hypothetical protein